tara:strand:- start:516 stop:1433 length:918 start_codon:yes stop_codon:yes gene_type:complete
MPCGVRKLPILASEFLQRDVISKLNTIFINLYSKLLSKFTLLSIEDIDLCVIRKNLLNNFAGAWIFYTIFPELPFLKPKFKNIAQFSPALGLVIGLIQSLVFTLLTTYSWSPIASAIICLVSGYILTGGLHIDGLMDTFDGLYANKGRKLKAMKDSRVGSFGVLAMVAFSFLQLAAIIQLENNLIYSLPICLFWGRFSTLIYIEKFKYISYKSKTISHKKYWRGLNKESTISILLLAIIIILNFSTSNSYQDIIKNLSLFFISMFCAFQVPKILGKKLGGFNGDSCGACIILCETILLLIYSIFP